MKLQLPSDLNSSLNLGKSFICILFCMSFYFTFTMKKFKKTNPPVGPSFKYICSFQLSPQFYFFGSFTLPVSIPTVQVSYLYSSSLQFLSLGGHSFPQGSIFLNSQQLREIQTEKVTQAELSRSCKAVGQAHSLSINSFCIPA